MNVSAEECRRVLASSSKYPTEKYLRIFVQRLTLEQKFILVNQLLPELNSFYSPAKRSEARDMYTYLTDTIKTYEGISRNEFISLIEEGTIDLAIKAVNNPKFPMDLLFENSIFNKYSINPNFKKLQENIALSIWHRDRFDEAIAYARSLVPGSEFMNNTMVMGIVGAHESYETISILNDII